VLYSLYGGLKAVALTDIVQVVILIIGGFAITWIALDLVGGEAGAVDWLQYEDVDEPTFALGSEMIDAYRAGGIDSMMTRYDEARAELSAAAYEELSLNTLGYKFYRLGMFDEAIAVFELNTRQFPNAYNAWDSLGEAHLASGNLDAALESYRRSVELNPDHRRGRMMVQRIEQQLAATSDGR